MTANQSIPSQKGNYLSRIRPPSERRRFERRKCQFMARALFTAKGTRGITQFIVMAVDISEVGVRLYTEQEKDIPRHFYFFVGKHQHGIGCTVIAREKNILRCEFMTEQDQRMVDYLAGVTNPSATLGMLTNPVFTAIAERKT
nr:PilZ domain-containing protein [uncultured Gellertiella sp.]